jgi:flavorubredoxin
MGSSDVYQLPREIADGIFWLGACLVTPFYDGGILHSCSSTYLITGSESSVLVDTGHTKDIAVVEAQLDQLIAAGAPEPRYLFATHSETAHAGGMGPLLKRFPGAVACGDVTDMHLAFPQYEDRLLPLEVGDSLDLGGTQFQVVEAVFRDYISTRWGFDTARRALFSGDGFAYVHYHESDQCGHLSEEVPDLGVEETVAMFKDAAFYWTRFVDIEPYIDRLDELIFDELDATLIAPTHGLPMVDPASTLPKIYAGYRTIAETR